MSERLSRVMVIALAAPLCAATCYLVAIAAAERAGTTLLADAPPANLAEAAARGRADVVVRLLRLGADPGPDRVYALPPEAISSSVLRATTMEAAMWSRQGQMIELLDREGAMWGQEHRRTLACLAADLDIPEIVEYLSPEKPPLCERGKALERVLARTAPL